MVVAVRNAWTGKVPGVPNFQPTFWASSAFNQGNSYPSMVQAQPGRYHSWVYSACTAIIQPLIDLPVVMYKKENEEDLIEEHPVLDLMKKPNPFMVGTNFFEAIAWNLLLTTLRTPGGQAFIVGEKPTNFRKGEIPKELYVFGDDAMTARVDQNGILNGWTLGIGNQTMVLELDQVIRINLFNKYDWKLGLSPLAAAIIEVDQDAKAKEFNSRFLENNATPGGMLSLDGAPPSQEIWKALTKQFEEKYAGYQNAGKTLFMPWMLKYEQFTRSHLDFSYMEQLGWNRDAILAAYRVNKWSVGITEELNYATSKEAKRQVYENAVLPLCRVIWTALNENWIRFLDKRSMRGKVDLSEVPALHEDRSVKIKDAQVLVDLRVPPSAAFEFVGLDIDTSKFPWLEEDASPFSALDKPMEEDGVAAGAGETADPNTSLNGLQVSSLLEIITMVAQRDLPRESAVQIIASSFNLSAETVEAMLGTVGDTFFVEKPEVEAAPKPGATAKPPKEPTKAYVTKDERDNLSKSYIEKLFTPGEKEALPVITRYFTSQRNAMQAHAKEVLKGLTSLNGFDPKTLLLDKKDEDGGLIRSFQPVFMAQTRRTLRNLRSEMPQKALNLDSTEEEIRDFLRSRLLALSEINATTFAGVEKELADLITSGIDQSLNMQELGKAINDGIFDVYQGRLKQTGMIARTETATVTNGVRFEVFQSAGIQKQEWLTAKDTRVRESHLAEDGHIVPLGETFPETGLKHPNDPNGPAHEVINCRCVALAVEE